MVSVSAHRLGNNSYIGSQWKNVVDESAISNVSTGQMYSQLIGRGVNSELTRLEALDASTGRSYLI